MTQDTTPQTKLLICGSRHDVTPAMIEYAKKATLSAYNNDWLIYAGDAFGIDKIVAEQMKQFRITLNDSRLVVAGLASDPRHGISGVKIDYAQLPARNYTKRDRYMVENSDKVLCIWNGDSKGTKANYDYAVSLGKAAWLVNKHGIIIERNES